MLGALLAVQCYIAGAKELPVPQFVLRQLKSHLAEANLSVTFARAQFDPTGRLFLESVQLRTLQFEDPVLVAQSAFVSKSFWALLSGARQPEEIRLDGATLQLPAPLSPTGTVAPLLRDFAGTVRFDGSLAHLDQLAFRVGNLSVTAHGDYHPERPTEKSSRLVGAVITQMLRVGRQLARNLAALEVLEHPALHVELHVQPGIGNVAELSLTADALQRPLGRPIETGALVANTSIRLDGTSPRPLRVVFSLEQANYDNAALSGRLLGVAATEIAPQAAELPEVISLFVASGQISAFGEKLVAPVLDVQWSRTAPLELALAATVHDAVFALTARVDLTKRTANLVFDGSVPPSLVASVLPKRTPRLAPYFRFGDPVLVHATADFAEDWEFTGLRAHVRGGRLDSNGVQVTSTRGIIDLDRAGNFLAQEAFLTAGSNHARGSYGMNFHSHDYRMLLSGALQPPDIAGWFRTNWWLDFWERIQFTGAAPLAEIDLQGNWRDPRDTTYFGSTNATHVVVLGADFSHAHARVFVRPHFSHVFGLKLARADGAQQASGWFKRSSEPVSRELQSYEFDLAGNLDPETVRHLGGDTAISLLQPWHFSTAPELALQGRIGFSSDRTTPELKFSGHAVGPMTYSGFPLEEITATGGISGTNVRLDQIDVRVASGRGSAKAALSGEGERRQLGFDFYLAGADLVQTLRTLNEFEQVRTPNEAPVSPNREFLKRASGGRLNFALSAQGNPDDLASFRGSGNLEIAGSELGEIHLFGLLSQVLSGLSLSFSSLKLDTLRGSYQLADGRVNFPDLRVTGPTAAIEARGKYVIQDKTLDFTARLRPYEANRNLITGVIGIVVNPLAGILEMRLTGPIRKPNWSLSLGSSTTREKVPASPGTPAEDTQTKFPAEKGEIGK
ncbi:MAG: AsmA-like C-terminal region-containing protein [Candidatus Didemnitutus sp.]|nr:AsmA-like C-terminal region-containing protein [Candidatus Didemnitutus sp.]